MEDNCAGMVGPICSTAPLRRSTEDQRLRRPETRWRAEKCPVPSGFATRHSAAVIESRDEDPYVPPGQPLLRSRPRRLAADPLLNLSRLWAPPPYSEMDRARRRHRPVGNPEARCAPRREAAAPPVLPRKPP